MNTGERQSPSMVNNFKKEEFTYPFRSLHTHSQRVEYIYYGIYSDGILMALAPLIAYVLGTSFYMILDLSDSVVLQINFFHFFHSFLNQLWFHVKKIHSTAAKKVYFSFELPLWGSHRKFVLWAWIS